MFFQDSQAKYLIKCVMALPMLPSNKIADGFSFLQSALVKSTFRIKETKNSLLNIMRYIQGDLVKSIGRCFSKINPGHCCSLKIKCYSQNNEFFIFYRILDFEGWC